MELYNKYRATFKKVTKEDIENYAKQYRGSETEKQDIISFYNNFKGDVR